MNKAKLFMTGKSQAVRLPKLYRFKGNEVYIKKIGNTVLLIPLDNPWKMMIESLDEFTDDFMHKRSQPEIEMRMDLYS